MSENTLYYGDNLDVLKRYVEDGSVDLVYLDPPFKSNQNYNVLFVERDGTRSAAQTKAFDDTWKWDMTAEASYRAIVEGSDQKLSETVQAFRRVLGESDMMAYLVMMAPRLSELRRVLKSTGCIYLHCDPTASHYLKSLMDSVFGPQNFRNEIVWKRHNSRSTEGRWPRIHDVILFYTKTDSFVFHSTKAPADPRKMPHTLITRGEEKFQTYELTAPGMTSDGESGRPWRGYDPSAMGRHWANSHAQMDAWDAKDEIHWPQEEGFPRRLSDEPFDPESRMITVSDVWTDIDRLNQTAKERLGYPTQKPEALLERIILASSNSGDTVLDPFCGCGTSICASQRLGRRWVGIDITHLAVALIKHRLDDAFGASAQYAVVGEPVAVPDAETLASQDQYQFQWWALGLVRARPLEQKKGPDQGIDGVLYFHDEDESRNKSKLLIIQVKAGRPEVKFVRDLRGTMERDKAAIAVLITMHEPTGPMRKEAAQAGFYDSPGWGTEHPRLQILTIEELLNGKKINMPPSKQVNVTHRRAPRAKGKPSAEMGELFDKG